jgi:anti-anti-sigma regulatory factor
METPAPEESPPFDASLDFIEVARAQQTVFMRVHGLATAPSAVALEDFFVQMMEQECGSFVLDLQNCIGMDSTFMGTLVGLSHTLKEEGRCRLSIVNSSQANRNLMETLGVDRFVTLLESPHLFPEVEMVRLAVGTDDDETRLDSIRRAHENLMAIEQKNRERFAPFLNALSSEMKRRPKSSGA